MYSKFFNRKKNTFIIAEIGVNHNGSVAICKNLIKFAKNLNVDLNSLISTVKINNKIRSEYNDIDSRESEQNVSFDDKI